MEAVHPLSYCIDEFDDALTEIADDESVVRPSAGMFERSDLTYHIADTVATDVFSITMFKVSHSFATFSIETFITAAVFFTNS